MNEKVCKLCSGTGWISEKKGDKEFVRRCRCQSRDRLLSRSERANIPQRFAGGYLEFYELDKNNDSQMKAIKSVKKFIDEYPAVEKGLLLQGPTGVGKTRLLCAIASELMNKFENIDIFYIDWNDMVREMRSGEDHASRDFTTINNLINRLTDVELLLFDELGASRVSQWVSDNIYYLFNKRYNNKKFTVCATNFFDVSEREEGETLTQRIGERLRSRLYEMAASIEIRGDDFRQKQFHRKKLD